MEITARKPIEKKEVYLKYGFVYVEHKFCYCPGCNSVLNAGPNYQPGHCSQCGQKTDFSGMEWEEEKALGYAEGR